MTQIAISTASSVACAHCRRMILQSGVIGPWILRACSDRVCRDRYDGAWNLIVRTGDLAVSVPLQRRLAKAIAAHLSNSRAPLQGEELLSAAGALWCGPVMEMLPIEDSR